MALLPTVMSTQVSLNGLANEWAANERIITSEPRYQPRLGAEVLKSPHAMINSFLRSNT